MYPHVIIEIIATPVIHDMSYILLYLIRIIPGTGKFHVKIGHKTHMDCIYREHATKIQFTCRIYAIIFTQESILFSYCVSCFLSHVYYNS